MAETKSGVFNLKPGTGEVRDAAGERGYGQVCKRGMVEKRINAFRVRV